MYHRKSTSIFLVIIATVISLAVAGPPEKVINGFPAKPGEFPYQVSLMNQGMHFCGGAIIDSHHILTASHCFSGYKASDITVVTGTADLRKGGTPHKVKAIKSHPLYKGKPDSWRHDIGVVTLWNPIMFDDKTKPISLPSASSYNDDLAVFTGWSVTKNGTHYIPPYLKKLTTLVKDVQYCQRGLRFIPLHQEQICGIQATGRGTCQGDSGGPLVVGNEIIGVASFNIPCAQGFPDMYTKVYDYLNFIKRAVSEYPKTVVPGNHHWNRYGTKPWIRQSVPLRHHL